MSTDDAKVKRVYQGEVGAIYGVRFIKSSMDKWPEPREFPDEQDPTLKALDAAAKAAAMVAAHDYWPGPEKRGPLEPWEGV